MADDGKNRSAKTKADIEVDPKRTVFIQKIIKPAQQIAVIDEETQRKYPSLVVSPTATVQKRDFGLFLNSEPDVSSNK